MKKVQFQGLVVVLIFLSVFFAASRVDWITLFRVKYISEKTEKKLGEIFDNVFRKTETIIHDHSVIHKIDSLLTLICDSNGIDKESITWYVVKRDEVNAFVFPDRHLVVFSGLIYDVQSDAALSGVLCHELAHMEKNHVMRKLKKEVGVSVLLSVATGNGSPGLVMEIARQLSSSAYSRSLEKEADISAVDFLMASGIAPEPFADFLEKFADDDVGFEESLSWVSSHPHPAKRAEYVRRYILEKQGSLNEEGM